MIYQQPEHSSTKYLTHISTQFSLHIFGRFSCNQQSIVYLIVVSCTRVICLICTLRAACPTVWVATRTCDTTDMYHDCRLIARGWQPITLANTRAITGSIIQMYRQKFDYGQQDIAMFVNEDKSQGYHERVQLSNITSF